MKEIKKEDQQTLDQKFKIDYGQIVSDNISTDTTRKWGIKYGNAHIESVFIPNLRTESQGTLCFSSQYGCSLKVIDFFLISFIYSVHFVQLVICLKLI